MLQWRSRHNLSPVKGGEIEHARNLGFRSPAHAGEAAGSLFKWWKRLGRIFPSTPPQPDLFHSF